MRMENNERCEEMLIDISEILRLYNKPRIVELRPPFITAEEAIQRIRNIVREEDPDI